jgi:hypothetical protein
MAGRGGMGPHGLRVQRAPRLPRPKQPESFLEKPILGARHGEILLPYGSSQKTEALSATSPPTTVSVFPSRTTTVPQRQLPGPSEALHLRGKRTRGPRLLQADATPQDPRHLEP